MPSIKLTDATIVFREQGKGFPAILIIHGAGGSSLHFSEIIRLIGQKRHAVAIDLPGHGNSPLLKQPPHPKELLSYYCNIVADFAEKQGLGKFILVGHSMGGAIAQLFALAHPDRLTKLILIATAARLKVAPVLLKTLKTNFTQGAAFLAAMGYSPINSSAQIQRWTQDQFQAPQKVVLDDFVACSYFDLREQIHSIKIPTTIISGADDRITPPKLQQQLFKMLPFAHLQTISRAGHFLVRERPDEVARIINYDK